MFKIGNVNFKNNLALAPMAAVNTKAFREMCVNYGAGMVYSAMIHAESLVDDPDKTVEKYIDFENEPLIGQLVGYRKDKLVEAVKILSKYCKVIDLNCGCCEGNVLGGKGGCYLTKHPDQMHTLLKAMIKKSSVPITCKIRLGWDGYNYKEVVKAAESAGVSAIAVHARIKKQGFSGKADWTAIKEIKKIAKVPIIGNGDVNTPERALAMLNHTNCDAVMIGRWSIGNAYCFKQINDFMKTGSYKKLSDYDKILEFEKFFELYKKQKRQKITEVKQHALWFIKGTKKKKIYLKELENLESFKDVNSKIEKIKKLAKP